MMRDDLIQMSLPEMRNRFSHDCELPPEEISYNLDSPYDSIFRKFLNWFRVQSTVSQRTESTSYYRSQKEFAKEKRRHLETPKYRYVIHPFSVFAYWKSICFGVLTCVMILTEFYVGTFMAEELLQAELPTFEKTIFVINVLYILNLLSMFFEGFKIAQTRSVVLEPRAVVKEYLMTYFLFDFAPIFGLLMFHFMPKAYPKTRMWLYQFHKFRLIRLQTILDKAEKLLRHLRVREAKRLLFMLGLIYLLILYALTCISGHLVIVRKLYNINYERSLVNLYKVTRKFVDQDVTEVGDRTPFQRFLLHFTVVCYHFLGIGNVNAKTKDQYERMYFAFVTMGGLCFYLYCLAKTLQFFSVINISESRYEELILQAEHFMIQRNYSQDLKKRIFNYYNYKYNQKFFSESTIMRTLSEHLQMEVLLYSCQNLIDRVQMFKGLSKSAVGAILALLKQEIYVPEDIILLPADDTTSVYFILFGTCGIVLPTGKEVLHIEDGEFFGDDEKVDFYYSVVALEMAEVYKWSTEDIEYCCAAFPEITSKLEFLRKNRARKYRKVVANLNLDEDEDYLRDDILVQLRRGRILAKGLKRQLFLD